MPIRKRLFLAWALIGVPIAYSLLSYIGGTLLGRFPNSPTLTLTALIAGLAICICSGLAALLSVVGGSRLFRIGISIGYAGGMYLVLLGAGFMAMCAYGGCGA